MPKLFPKKVVIQRLVSLLTLMVHKLDNNQWKYSKDWRGCCRALFSDVSLTKLCYRHCQEPIRKLDLEVVLL